jgi:hypothetical protein
MGLGRPRVFAVVSWGCCATHWLAQVLDRHPDVRCFHALNANISRVGGSALEPVAYARLLRNQALGYRAAGDVHGIPRMSVDEVQQSLGNEFRCAALIRDPLPRFRSILGIFKEGAWRTRSGPPPWDVEYVKASGREAGIDLGDDDYEGWLVVHGANMLNEIVYERRIGPVYRMEDVVSSPEVLCSLVSHLTAGEVQPDRGWADQMIVRPSVFGHSRGGEPTQADLDVLERIVWPEAWEAYRELGYAC